VNQYLTELQPTAQFVDYPMGNEVIRIETDGTLEERVTVLEEVLQEQVMAVTTAKEDD
jgi:hypothetical protein